MRYRIEESAEDKGAYAVIGENEATAESIRILFSGLDAKRHAEEYADWKNRQAEITGEQLLQR
jgi:hypothetical protein